MNQQHTRRALHVMLPVGAIDRGDSNNKNITGHPSNGALTDVVDKDVNDTGHAKPAVWVTVVANATHWKDAA